jgi:hypothetical protein
LPQACAGYVEGLANCISGRAGNGGQECVVAVATCLTDTAGGLRECSGGAQEVSSSAASDR